MSTRDTLVTLGLLAAGGVAITAASRGRAGSRSDDMPDLSFASLREGQRVEGGAPYRASGVVFDSREGAGSTPNNRDVDYFGLVAWLRPSEFLALNPSMLDVQQQATTARKLDAWMVSLADGVRLGPPMLYVEVKSESEDEDGRPKGPATLAVKAHEGRHRMAALRRLSDEPVPVHVIPRGGLRARHLGGLDLDETGFLSDRRSKVDRFIRPHAVALDGVVHLVRGR